MKKLKSKAGITLIEMMVSLLILVFLVVGMGPGMETASRIYREATFETDSGMLARIINNAMGDILRYAEDVDTEKNWKNDPHPPEIPFVFTSYDYRIQDAYFYLPEDANGNAKGVLQMKNLRNGSIVDLVNTGAYPDLQLSGLEVVFDKDNGIFTIRYIISSISDPAKTRDISHVVRLMNT